MRKNFIRFLSVFTILAVVALILIQLAWIRDALKVQEDQFRLLVNKSLGQITTKLERKETLSQIQRVMANDGDTLGLALLSQPEWEQEFSDLETFDSPEASQSIFYNPDGEPSSSPNQFDMISGDTSTEVPQDNLYQRSLPESERNSGIQTPSMTELYNSLLTNKRLYLDKILNQLVTQEGSIEDRIDYPGLDSLIREEFRDKGIEIPYEFAVRSGTSRYTLRSPGFDPKVNYPKYATWLFPHDVRSTPNFLVVYFPTRDNYLRNSVGVMAGSSLILALIILIFSFAAIYIIYRQKKVSEIKNDFISNMTHELKTPIATISLASQMLADKGVQEGTMDITRIFSVIQEESKRLGTQVERVLQMSIFDEKKVSLKIKEIQFDRLVRHAADKIALQLDQRKGNMSLDLQCGDITLQGDETHLQNVIFNLIDNALKYCTGNPDIQIRTRPESAQIRFEIEDNGVGIEKEHLKKIFEKFYRVPTGNIHDVKGFGLGLSYVRKVVDQHHGSLNVMSTPGVGTTFILTLPLKQKEKR